MTKIIMLGTGSGGTLDLYNTCFVIQNDEGDFLVDTGGSVEIVKRLKEVDIKLDDVKNIFVSHSHTDHILGLIWIFKKIGSRLIAGDNKEKVNIYCNDVVYEAIKGIASFTLPDGILKKIYNVVNFVILNDGDKYTINGVTYEFFDILARGVKQFGFECMLDNKRFIFLGDEPLNANIRNRVYGADYVMHEAFCLDCEEKKFNAYAKNHSTALSAAKTMNDLNVQNLILYHTEETHGNMRKELYEEEAEKVFEGNVLVPNDLEEIKLTLRNH